MGFSPAQEALHSLHVLFAPKDHPLHIPWVIRIRERMSPVLKGWADSYRFLAQGKLPVFWDVREGAEIRTFEEEVERFRRTGLHEFRLTLLSFALGRTCSPAEQEEPLLQLEALRTLEGRSPEGVPVLAELLTDPQRSHQRFADFLQAYWDHALADDWPRIQELFLQDIEHRARSMVRRGAMGALTDLAPNARLDHTARSLMITSRSEVEVALGPGDRLCLMPTYFSWPTLLINAVSSPYLITYPVFEHRKEGRPPVPPEQLLKMLRAAGDMTRVQILQLIAQQPRSTTELAKIIGISEAAVNKHLKQLQEAGLVAAERRSYYVFYHLVRQALREMAQNLESTLTGER